MLDCWKKLLMVHVYVLLTGLLLEPLNKCAHLLASIYTQVWPDRYWKDLHNGRGEESRGITVVGGGPSGGNHSTVPPPPI